MATQPRALRCMRMALHPVSMVTRGAAAWSLAALTLMLTLACSAEPGAVADRRELSLSSRAEASDAGDAGAAAAPTVAERVAALVQPLIDEHWVMGIEVALIEGGRSTTYGFGATREGGPVPDERTLFEIGSVTKTFTGLLLAELVEEGQVRLDQPVAELLPSGVRVPDFQGQPITLVDLATHTSGLPRLPTNLLEQLTRPEDLLDPYARYAEADLFEFLASYELSVAPGTVEEYSNLGFGLLGYAVSRADGTSYASAVERRISEPLGLVDTAIVLTDEQRARLAQGHGAELDPRPAWNFLAPSEGAGALRSTARDLAAYLVAQRDESPPGALDAGAGESERVDRAVLGRAIELSHQVFRPRAGAVQTGLGWSVLPDAQIILHNGGTGGFDSFVAFDTRDDLGVVVLSNTSGYDRFTDLLGFALLTLLYGGDPAPLVLPPRTL